MKKLREFSEASLRIFELLSPQKRIQGNFGDDNQNLLRGTPTYNKVVFDRVLNVRHAVEQKCQ